MGNKIYENPKAALEGVLFDKMTIMSGGFGLSGNPESLIPAIRDSGVKELIVISNNCGAAARGFVVANIYYNQPSRQEGYLTRSQASTCSP